MWLTAHRRVNMATTPFISAALVGEIVRREKALDSSGCNWFAQSPGSAYHIQLRDSEAGCFFINAFDLWVIVGPSKLLLPQLRDLRL
jgi:hypothetical protein